MHNFVIALLSSCVQIAYASLTIVVIGQHYCWSSGIIKKDCWIGHDKAG